MYSGTDYTWWYDSQEDKNFLLWDHLDSYNDISLVDLKYFSIWLQWADDWYDPSYDLAMDWCDENGTVILTTVYGLNPNQVLEFFDGSPWLDGDYKLRIWWRSELPTQDLEIKVLFKYTLNADNPNSEYSVENLSDEKHMYGHVIGGNVISVAATDWQDLTSVESFSSHGPAVVFTGLGTEERQHPKITATDGVSTYVWGVLDGKPFYGTSASAPHIAGVAAQYFTLFPNDSYSEFLFHLKSSASPFDGGDPNNWSPKSGYGLADSYGTIDHKYNSSEVNIRQLDKNDIIFGEAE